LNISYLVSIDSRSLRTVEWGPTLSAERKVSEPYRLSIC
jgi:hypothetical protein